jgi:hypothetical protein
MIGKQGGQLVSALLLKWLSLVTWDAQTAQPATPAPS